MKRVILISILLLLVSATFASVKNTWKWAGDFNGLLILLSVAGDDRSYNPYSNDFLWLSQDMALFILKNMSYPYERCSSMSKKMGGCEQPRVEYAGRFIGMVNENTEKKVFELIEFLVSRGEPINTYSSDGYTALQSAILGNSPELVSVLLKSGADPYLTIKREGKLKGKNSIEYVELLYKKDQLGFAELRAAFYEQMPNNSGKKDAASGALARR